MSFDGLCVLITGSASGLGAATAKQMAKQGARLILNYASSKKDADETADICRAEGAEIVVVQGDVSSDEDCKKLLTAASRWGRLDVLVNNAGTTKHVPDHGLLSELSAADFRRIFDVNVIGAFQMVRAARALLEEGARAAGYSSAVVNISSAAGISGAGTALRAHQRNSSACTGYGGRYLRAGTSPCARLQCLSCKGRPRRPARNLTRAPACSGSPPTTSARTRVIVA